MEVAQGKTSCKTSKSGYLRIGKTHGGGGEGEVGIEEEGARILAGVDRLRWEVLPLPPAGQPLAGPAPLPALGFLLQVGLLHLSLAQAAGIGNTGGHCFANPGSTLRSQLTPVPHVPAQLPSLKPNLNSCLGFKPWLLPLRDHIPCGRPSHHALATVTTPGAPSPLRLMTNSGPPHTGCPTPPSPSPTTAEAEPGRPTHQALAVPPPSVCSPGLQVV